jgi:hypothetical protein
MPTPTLTTTKPRVVIDFEANGDFVIYFDQGVEVICRHAHCPDDELYRYGHFPIPAEWLEGKRIGFRGDGSDADQRIQWLREAFEGARGA